MATYSEAKRQKSLPEIEHIDKCQLSSIKYQTDSSQNLHIINYSQHNAQNGFSLFPSF